MFAVASGEDGVALVKRLGADAAVDGHRDDVAEEARNFAPNGIDAALVTAGGEEMSKALSAVRDGGRVAYPTGVEPAPQGQPWLTVSRYDGTPTSETIQRLNRLIEAGPFEVHVAKTFPLERAGEAQSALHGHYLGKMALRPN